MKRAEEMRELFARWEKSGQSLMAFGKKEGVSYSRLLYWRRKFRGKDPSANAAELVPVPLRPLVELVAVMHFIIDHVLGQQPNQAL